MENTSLYAHELDIGLGFRHLWIELSCPNNNNNIFFIFLFFKSVSLYTIVIYILCAFSFYLEGQTSMSLKVSQIV